MPTSLKYPGSVLVAMSAKFTMFACLILLGLASTTSAGTMAPNSNATEMSSALVADTSAAEGKDWVVVVDTVICASTIIGASAILISMLYREIYKRRASAVRMRLVQGLVLSDLILGIIGIITAGEYLSGRRFEHGSNFCDAMGFLLVAVLWSEHLWTFFLAFATYMILIYPLHSVTRYLETSWYWIYLIVWIVSIGFATLGYLLYGYWPSGGICYYGTNSKLYGELLQFLPRACVFIAVAFFYARLYIFLRRPDSIKASFSRSGGGQTGRTREEGTRGLRSADSSATSSTVSEENETSQARVTRRSRISSNAKIRDGFNKFTFRPRPASQRTDMDIDMEEVGKSKNRVRAKDYTIRHGVGNINSQFASRGSITQEAVPPWERIELPAFIVDGERFGGPSSVAPATSSLSPTILWNDWKTSGQRRARSSSDSGQPVRGHGPKSSQAYSSRSRQESSASGFLLPAIAQEEETYIKVSPPSPAPPPTFSRKASDISPKAVQRAMFETPRSYPVALDLPPPIMTEYAENMDQFPDSTHTSDNLTPSSSSTAHLKSTSLSSSADTNQTGIRRDSYVSPSDTESRRGSGPVSFVLPMDPRKEPMPSHLAEKLAELDAADGEKHADIQSRIAVETNDEEADDEDDGEMDFGQFLEQEGDPDETQDSRFPSEDTIFQEESTASYLNRKTAMLMLYFPLAYCALFSVSIIRLIYDFASTSEPIGLRAVSRWFVFAQGAVDAFIYGFVEWNTKRIVRKKVRKGLMTPKTSRSRHSWGAGMTAAEMLSTKKAANPNKTQELKSRTSQLDQRTFQSDQSRLSQV